MSVSSGMRPSSPWLLYAAIGLGFCLASTEYERYTVLWAFETRSLIQVVLIVALLVLLLVFIVARESRRTRAWHESKLGILLLVVMQTVGLCARLAEAQMITLPSWVSLLGSVCRQSAGLLFVLYAEFFLEVGIKKSLRTLALGILIAGTVQILIMGFPAEIGLFALLGFAPLSGIMLMVANRSRNLLSRQRECEDVRAERIGRDASHETKESHGVEYCMGIMLMTILLLALHSQGMSHQDNGEGSRIIQASAGFGGIAAGLIFLLIANYLHESEFLELFRLLALPLILTALYISSLLGGAGLVPYLVLLGISYAIVLLFVWSAARSFLVRKSLLLATCLAYFFYRLGWAVGICGIMIAPSEYGEHLKTGVILLSFLLLLALSVIRLVRNRQNGALSNTKESRAHEAESYGDALFTKACDHVSTECRLTPREKEVLVLLARGRNAKYVAEALIVSDGTARTHIMHIYQKMQINSQQVLMDRIDSEMHKRQL